MALLLSSPSGGAFSPLILDSNGYNFSYSLQSGNYSKWGNTATFAVKIHLDSNNPATGLLSVGNLPFQFLNDQAVYGYYHNISINCTPFFLAKAGTNIIELWYSTGTSNTILTQLPATRFVLSGTFVLYCSSTVLIQ